MAGLTHPPPNAEAPPCGCVFCAILPNVMPVDCDEPSDSNSEFDWPVGAAKAGAAAAAPAAGWPNAPKPPFGLPKVAAPPNDGAAPKAGAPPNAPAAG